jgi:hypothetical protein
MSVSVTVPTLALVLPLIACWLVAWLLAARWLDRRYVDPWLRRRLGLPPRARDDDDCAHEFWDFGVGGYTFCRACGADTTDMEAMGS